MDAPLPGPLPGDFLWGAATASYQVEGHPLADGACPSNWHRFAHRRGKVQDGTNGDLASDHYHRWAEDIRHMKEMGLGAYRFSVAWPRVVPEPGRLNPRGLAFYDRLVDGLLEAGVRPFATLFHWDLPAWLEDRGGFVRREALEHLAFYAEAVFRTLGDRVGHWLTINEPMIYAFFGYVFGHYPPGLHWRLRPAFAAAHHLLLGHARLVRLYRSLAPAGRNAGRIGIANHLLYLRPLRPGDERDVRAARRAEAVVNRFFLDPLYFGRYPEEALRRVARYLPRGWEQDLPEMREPGDFLGLNYYSGQSYRHAPLAPVLGALEAPTPGARRSAMWEVAPQGLGALLRLLQTEYGNPPVYITENGYPLPERPGADPLEDGERIEYLGAHIGEALQARRQGADLRGFFVWSLLDNFEWHLGNAMRFGLIRVDFASGQRTWRRSASWYRDLIRQ
jgi:beta-glucosidase